MFKQDFIDTKTKRRSGLKIKGVKFIVAHDTGNKDTTAQGNVNYYKASAKSESASAHAFIDDKGIVQCIPITERAWHVQYGVDTDNKIFGFDANDYALGIELCFFPKDAARSKKAYDCYVQYIAALCKMFNLIPAVHVVGHYQLDPSRRKDPLNAFKYINKTWGNFIDDLTAAWKRKK